MTIEKYTKEIYDKFGKEYQKSRDKKIPNRAYNEFLEVPCIIKAVGNIKGKKLLDVGCGAGVHIEKYLKKGAKVEGIDISRTMVELAKKRCKNVNLKIGSITKLPYEKNLFDIATASLMVDYIKDLKKAFLEVNRVLKKEGLFYYSDTSPIASATEIYENGEFRIRAVGYIEKKKVNKRINIGNCSNEITQEFEMVPGMVTKIKVRKFRVHLKAIRDAGFELIDLIDCKPTNDFKRYNPSKYKTNIKFPLFSIYVCKKK